MISADDIVPLAYSADLSQAGLLYARRRLPRLPLAAGRALHGVMRRMVVGAAVQLALQRYLAGEGIAASAQPPRPFSGSDPPVLAFGGRRCALKTFLISLPSQVEALNANLSVALDAPALVPVGEQPDDASRGDDVLLFAFATAKAERSAGPPEPIEASSRRDYWVGSMPPAWSRPRMWAPWNPLALKSEVGVVLGLELTGQDGAGSTVDVTVELPAGERVEIDVPIYSVSHLYARIRPEGRIGVHSIPRRATCVLSSSSWEDMWIEGLAILVLGWITRDEFHSRAHVIPRGTKVFQFHRTKARNLAVEVSNLKPLRQLVARARDGNLQRRLY